MIRIPDPAGRIIPAGEFIHKLEELETGRLIDCKALEIGLRTLAANPQIKLSINMLARSIGYGRWLENIGKALRYDSTLGTRLILEITESSAILVPELVMNFMHDMNRRGIRFALDDFSSGATSFRYLRDFHFDVLKIDGQFMRNMESNADNQVLTQALISTAEHFDMFAIAEAVETVEAIEWPCSTGSIAYRDIISGFRLFILLGRRNQKSSPDYVIRQLGSCRIAAFRLSMRSRSRFYLRCFLLEIAKMTNVVIASAARTAVGSFTGSFAYTPAHDLGTTVLKALVDRAGIEKSEVSETILGQVLSAGQGQNPARQAHVNAGLPIESSAWGINQVCGSGLRAVALAAQHIQLGDANIVAAGGQENMSLSPHVAHLRASHKMGDLKYIDCMIKDGLWDAFNGYHMGQTAENVAQKWQISRDMQDEFAVSSQNKAEAAQKAGKFADEITPFTVKTRKCDIVVNQDEYIRHGVTIENMQKLRPAFVKEGSVTAANASGINDGAAGALLMSADEAEKRGIEPLARIASYATVGLDPAIMGVGPVYASRKALEKAGWSVSDLDLVEANEAFAAQACAVNKDMGWDPAIVNVNGGAIAIGHPIGASGARILTTLLFEMKRRDAKKGLATLCIGGGMGVAMSLERD